MAGNTTRTLRVVFEASATQVVAAARSASAAIRSVQENQKGLIANSAKARTALAGFYKVLDLLGNVTTAAQVIVGLSAALIQVAPAALALPGILLGIGTAVGVVKLAFSGFGDALKGDAEAMAKLAPSAQAAVRGIQSLQGGFDKLKSSVQQNFFVGLGPLIQAAGTALLGVAQNSLPRVATGFNGMAKAALAAVQTPLFKGQLGSIFDNTGAAIERMRNTLANLISGFIGLGSVGAQYLPAIGAAIDSVTAKFAQFVARGVETGSIKRSIDAALEAIRQFGAVIVNVGGIAAAIFTGLSQGGAQNFLTKLVDITAALRTFFEAAETQTALGVLGLALAQISTAGFNLVLQALQTITPLIVAFAPIVANVATVVSGFLVVALQALAGVFTFITPFIQQNQGLFTALGVAAVAVAGALALVGPALSIAGAAASAFGAAMSIARGVVAIFNGVVFAARLAVLGFQLVMIAIRGAVAAWVLIQGALNAVLLANPIAIVIAIIVGLIAIVVLAYQNSETFRNIVNAAWAAVKAGIAAAVNAIGGAIRGFVGFLNDAGNNARRVVDAVVGFFRRFAADPIGSIQQLVGVGSGLIARFSAFLTSSASNAARAVIGFFVGMATGVVRTLSALPGQMVRIGADIIAGIVRGLRSAAGAITNFLLGIARGALNTIKSFFGIASPSTVFRDQVGLQMGLGIADGLKASTGAVIAQARTLSDAAASAAAPDLGLTGPTGLVNGLTAAGTPAPATSLAEKLSAAMGSQPPADIAVTVMIGESELREIVDTQVEQTARDTARRVTSGVGR